ncbi:uncharacterized protein LOC126604734 isoform X2 [Malus sylvestris]|uniref:uncharacterized protein LOC126604734 isoform X2 n=1 Tax=Malus sylvestris TaxID=3752 RepID=UPI0021AC6FCA|nr:uncharacterized protein LOC126604734 isoform X2 [Malus sylvestris]
MANKKHFRFPWRRRSSQVEPDPSPVAKTKNPARTTTSAPVERPPFRPAGKAPVKASPSQAQAPLKIEPPPPSQPHTQEDSQLPSLSAESPSPATQPEPREPYAEISTSETIPKAQNNTPTAEQTHAASTEAVETVASPEKEDALEMNKLATEDQMLEKPVSVVTLSGENRGATMHNSSEPENGEEFMPIHRSYKTNPDDSLEATTDGEESSEGENFDQTSKDHQRIAYVNSNVQGINNSVVFYTSVAERNPGVKSLFSQKPAESIKPNGKSEPLETHKAEITKTPEKLSPL